MMRNLFFCCAAVMASGAFAQSAQVGADTNAPASGTLRVEYVQYRPAKCETEKITEFENEFLNQGGLVYVYFRNLGDKPVDLYFWRVNNRDESYYRMNHLVAWDRTHNKHVKPNEMGVLEINATSPDFGPGKPFKFLYMPRSERATARYEGVLNPDPVQIAYIQMLPGMKEMEVHVRNRGKDTLSLDNLAVEGHAVASVAWVGQELDAPGHAIAHVTLGEALQPGELAIVRVDVRKGRDTRAIYAHRRAYEDFFPIGTWTSNPGEYETLRRLHIETVVRGGRSDDPFYAGDAAKYGFRTMVHTGLPVDVDEVRDLGKHPAVLCWMLQDEPDWTIPANVMLFADDTVRRYAPEKPTFITLCRNIKMMEYAPICDIPCQDHYSVTAPSSSKWPKAYGTRLEETAYYTNDLKYASEPKPIWVWSQAMADWGERPKRPVPTPDELAAQLILNIGRGAKGILWFNYGSKIADKFPDVRDAMQGWGRVMAVLRNDLLASEFVDAHVKAPKLVDVAPLVTRDKLIVCLTNLDYQIDPQAYPFAEKKDVKLKLRVPSWIQPKAALRVSPDGIQPVPFHTKGAKATVDAGTLTSCGVIVLCNRAESEGELRSAFQQAIADETRAY